MSKSMMSKEHAEGFLFKVDMEGLDYEVYSFFYNRSTVCLERKKNIFERK